MFRQLNFRSFFTFLGRNKLYTTINIFGLSVSLMFVILIADYTLRQFSTDNYHTKADRIYTVSSKNGISSAYYLQKHLLDRYPEIEATCAVAVSGDSTDETEKVQAGTQTFAASAIYADSTFFRIFDFELIEGDREHALAARDNVVLSESFARRAFGSFNPMGQVLRLPEEETEGGKPKEFVVTGIIRDIDNSVIPAKDIILRAERLVELNPACGEQMNNAGACVTFLLEREGADIRAKAGDMVAYFKEFYWPYQGNVVDEVLLTPLREVYFAQANADSMLRHGNRAFLLILIAVGLVILVFAVINYINLTVAQTGFRAKEMAMRRLLGSARGEVILKMILESTLLCAAAFVVALALASAVEPYAARLLENRLDLVGDLRPLTVVAYALLVVVLGVLAGIAPALIISRYKPLDVMSGSLRRRTKMLYSSVLITLQNVITVVLIAAALTISLQIRHLIDAPLRYNTKDILDISTEIFRDYGELQRFRNELRQLPCVEAVALGCGTPLSRGNNNTLSCGPDRMVSFQTFIGDSTYFRMLGLEVLLDHHNPDAYMLNEYAYGELELPHDATNFKLGSDYSWNYDIGGTVRDFQIGNALAEPTAAMLKNVGDFDRYYKEGNFNGDNYNYPWDILVKTRGDQAEAFAAVREVYGRIGDATLFRGEYIEQQIAQECATEQRLLRIIGVFTLIAILISALGLLAMSTYYIQQKQQEIAVRKVFGSTRAEVLGRLVGYFMQLVGVAFVVAVPIAWYALSRWLEDYTVRIALSPLIFLAAGLFVALVALAVVFWQSCRAANANPVKSIKN